MHVFTGMTLLLVGSEGADSQQDTFIVGFIIRVMNRLEHFVCHLYTPKTSIKINELRYHLFFAS